MQMTYEQFLEAFKEMWDYPYMATYGKDAHKKNMAKPRLEVTWTTGGGTGGNCYDNATPESYPVDAEEEPEFQDLDRMLEQICPGITYLQYRKLGPLMKSEDHREHQYYGNYYDRRTKFVEALDLYGKLVELGFIEEAL